MSPDMCPGGGLFTSDVKDRPAESISKIVAKELLRNREFEIIDFTESQGRTQIKVECLSLDFDILLYVSKSEIVKLMNCQDLLEVI